MIKKQRQTRILSILNAENVVEISTLSRVMPEVSKVTLRRDIAELAELGALKRTHGGAVLPDAILLQNPSHTQTKTISSASSFSVDKLDAVILPPVSGRGGDALRRQITRRGIPFLAESAPQQGGQYLGPDNKQAGLELGRLAGQDAVDVHELRVLIVGHPELTNTRERAAGFEAGLREAFNGDLKIVSVNGQGSYRVATRVISDAMAAAEQFDVVFAVNDHSAIAAAELAQTNEQSVTIYATGGEAAEFVARVQEDSVIRAVAAFFPEVVGERAMDSVARALSHQDVDGSPTPHVVITAANLREYFEHDASGWRLSPAKRAALVGAPIPKGSVTDKKRIGFMPHYPAHEWYRTMISAMQTRARDLGFELVIAPPHQSISAEITRLRGQIAQAACDALKAGESIVIGDGEATLCLAEEIRKRAFEDNSQLAGLTVITNALDVLYRLDGAPGIKTILTSGEYQATDRCLVGPSLGALFERLRADRAFLSVNGVSTRFGISYADERLALAGSRFVEAARETVVLADHTQIGSDGNHRIARIEDIHSIITDDGAVPAVRQSLRSAGVDVLVAEEHGDTPENSPPDASERRSGGR